MKLDLTKAGLVLLLFSLCLFSFRQCSDKRMYKKSLTNLSQSYQEQINECLASELDVIDYHKKKNKVIRDSLNHYKQLAETYLFKANKSKAYTSSYKAHIKTLSDSIDKLSTEESIAYIDANFIPGGDDVSLTTNQIEGLHVVDLERKDCFEVVKLQEYTIGLLEDSAEQCMKGYNLAKKQLHGCEMENLTKDLSIKKLKKKSRNRTVFGVGAGVLLVLALL